MVDRSKVGKKSKRKGKKYESRVSSLLTNFTGVKFRRVPCSGGFNKTGGRVILEHIFSGDVICEDRQFRYSIEAKYRKDISLTALLKNPKTAALAKYWKQCVDDANSNKLKPMMFFKPNTNSDWVCLSIEDAKYVGLLKAKHMRLEVFNDLPNILLVDWHEFIEFVNPESLFKDGEKNEKHK